MKDPDALAMQKLEELLQKTEGLIDAGATALNYLKSIKAPINEETITLAMLLHAATSFKVALSAWVRLVEERQEELFNLNNIDGN